MKNFKVIFFNDWTKINKKTEIVSGFRFLSVTVFIDRVLGAKILEFGLLGINVQFRVENPEDGMAQQIFDKVMFRELKEQGRVHQA